MNKLFSIVWNTSIGGWVVASEHACNKTKRGQANSKAKKMTASAGLLATGLIISALSTNAFAGTAVQLDKIADGSTGGGSPATADAFSIAIGGGSGALATGISVAIGDDSRATGQNSVAVGRQTTATGDSSSTFGQGSRATGTASTAIGNSSNASEANSLALGANSSATTANSVALGNSSSTSTAVATTSGTINGANYTYAGGAPVGVVSVGSVGAERQISNVAAGRVSGTSTDAVNGSQLFATNTAVNNVGTTLNNIVTNGAGIKYFHTNSTLGDSSATGTNSIAVGPAAVASASNGMAFGNGARAATANSVALGSGAITANAIANTSGTINEKNYSYAGGTPIGVVSVGAAGSERQISNLAAGRVSATSTDAVNGSQLFATNSAVDDVGTAVKNIVNNGSGIKYFHSNSSLADSAATGTDSVAIGPAGSALGANSVAIGKNASAAKSDSMAVGSQAQAQEELSLALGTGAVSNFANSIALGANSVLSVGGQSGYIAYGLDAPQNSVGELGIGTAQGNRKITGVAAGSAPNDAANVAQLNAVGDKVEENTQNISKLDGRVSTVEGDIKNISNGGGIKYFHANSSKPDSVASGSDSIAVGGNAVASGSNSVATGSDSQASGNGSIAIGNGATASADGSVAIGQGSSDNGRGAESYTGKYSNAENNSVGTVSVGNSLTGENRTISNVADGRLDNDAVNVRQLDGAVLESKKYTDDSIKTVSGDVSAVSNRVTNVEGNVSKLQNGTDGMFQVKNTSALPKPSVTGDDSLAGGAGSVASGNNSTAVGTNANSTGEKSVALGSGAKATGNNSTAIGANSVADRDNSVSVGSVGAERQIANVAEGTNGTDAINLNQLNNRLSSVSGDANAYTDQRYNSLKRDLKKQDDTLSAGIAGAMAMASLPQPYAPGASMTSVGAANYRGQSALSVGVSRISDNGRWVSKLQASTNTQGDVGVGVGVGYQW